MKSYILPLTGTHCASCKLLIEDILAEDATIQNAGVNLRKGTLSVDSEIEDEKTLINQLNAELQPHGYSIPSGKNSSQKMNQSIFWTALPIGIVFLILFFLLQKSGILSLGIGGKITPVTSFLIGLVASVSSCLAMV
jgi:cation transport ATPase